MLTDDIRLFALSTCSHCRDCKALLAELGCNYTCIDVDQLSPVERKAMLAEIQKVNPRLSFPTLVVGDKVIVGFKKEEIQELLNAYERR
ncbi:MAG: glutaredoxin family protein [Desulfobacca sp.]|uniref:glutaredoxin family protein n=1 Tax=Desulfobacca sp. TaxID=2067990 RepID=UPI00404B7463